MNRMTFLSIMGALASLSHNNAYAQGVDVLEPPAAKPAAKPAREVKAQRRETVIDDLHPAAPEKSSALKRLLKQKGRK